MSETTPDGGPILLFDGVCNLCNGLVQFVIPRDPEGKIRFASLQSEVARDLLGERGLPTDSLESVVLVEGDEHYTKSAAAIRLAEHLGGAYALLSPFRVVPRPIRDAMYDFVAEHRYEWFGQRDQCMLPPPGVESRFLD